MDISSVIDKKMRAMSRLAHQYYDEMSLGEVPDTYYGLRTRDRYGGLSAEPPFTEVFIAHNPQRVYDSLPPYDARE